MQRYIIFLFLISVLTACNTATKRDVINQEVVLTVTIEPQRYFLEKIVGNQFKVNTLVPPGTSPETYEPAPSVMVDMAKSTLYFKVGDLGFEKAWNKRLQENNPNVGVIDCSEGIELMEGHHHHHHGSHESHGISVSHENHHHSDTDPHVWTSPKAVAQFTQNMLMAVIAADPDNEELYRSNYELLLKEIEDTDNQISTILKDAPTRDFIIYHPALSYFADDYDLHQHSIEFEGKSPSPAQLKELVDLANSEEINTVFIQKGFDAKNAEVIAREIGAEVFEIDPLSYNWSEELIRIATIIARNI